MCLFPEIQIGLELSLLNILGLITIGLDDMNLIEFKSTDNFVDYLSIKTNNRGETYELISS